MSQIRICKEQPPGIFKMKIETVQMLLKPDISISMAIIKVRRK
jgi:hypothetical protein